MKENVERIFAIGRERAQPHAAGGGSPTFNPVVLTIMTVPEPQTFALSLLGGLMAWVDEPAKLVN